ncbi:hypothetical protein CC80DRAFT_437190 [Byssothecium circinans]|uniref:Protein kinase domain-containing protein n=1 Tax=Byssothecium circinans TaxID=147558 RepID=A0A6A5UBT3_9PLEO|nr:hypothetical protein CC80DRAFT_437190 [Byssothecium circinans]
MSEPDLEASLLQRWFPVSPPGTLTQHEPFSETDLRDISNVLRRVGQGAWSRIPRIYAVLRLLDRLDVIGLFLAQEISDVYFPFTPQTLPQSLNPSVAHGFLKTQRVVLSSALDLERESGRHRHFRSADDVPFIKVEELGKGQYGFVDRVISTVSHKEYARKLIPRGRTFQRDQKILRDFERELGTLKKLRNHRHIVQLIGSYTDPRFVGIVMSPVAECDLKDFLHNCASDGKKSPQSFLRSFFGCLTSALTYLHDNTVRHKDIKPQNVLVSQHSVYLTDFGISMDWSDVGQSTTTGPTPKTARYCAPEVSDSAPRNTSSDMWSLGCVFLEIWTVLKGETVANLHAFLEANGALSSCYHLNIGATFSWMKILESRPTLADNPPLAWIHHLLAEDKDKRWTARQLLSEIENINSNPEAKFAFSGHCCMPDLESAESVISSNGSLTPAPISEVADIRAAHREAIGPRNEIAEDDKTLGLLNVEPQPDSTALIDESDLSRSASEVAFGNLTKVGENQLMAVVESPEKKLFSSRHDERATLSHSRTDNQERPKSTRPEISQATVASVSMETTPPMHLKNGSSFSGNTSQKGSNPTSKNVKVDHTDQHMRPVGVTGTDENVEHSSHPTLSRPEQTAAWMATSEPDHQNMLENVTSAASGHSTLSSAYAASDEAALRSPNISDTGPGKDDTIIHQLNNDISQKQPDDTARALHRDRSSSLRRAFSFELEPSLTEEALVNEPTSAAKDTATATDAVPVSYGIEEISRLEGNVMPPYSSPEPPPSLSHDLPATKNAASQSQLDGPEPQPRPTMDIEVTSSDKKPRRICSRCYEELTGQYVRACGGTFHLKCFTCADCEKIVASSFFPVPGKVIGGKFISLANPPDGHTEEVPLCEIDYFRRLDLLCHTCGQALRGSYITAVGHKYHTDHFTCSEPGCGLDIGTNDSYYEHDEAVLCKRHYLRHAHNCHGCEMPVLKQFVEIFRNGQNQVWHPECYMIHKFWNVRVQGEHGDFFTTGKIPTENGLEVDQCHVDASMDRTEKLMNDIWIVLSTFEEGCAASISDMLLHVSESAPATALSTSAYFILKIEKFFEVLDRLDKLNQAKEREGLRMSREQKLLCKKIVAFFALVASTHEKPFVGVTQELLSLVTGLAHYLKLLMRIGLQAAKSLDPYNKEAVISTFLNGIATIGQMDMQLELRSKFRQNDYRTSSADLCGLCQKSLDSGQPCYWTHSRAFHVDCISCPLCNGLPATSYDINRNPSVTCSQCDYGDMTGFISQNIGASFIILDSRSSVYAHLLFVAWARLAHIVKPNDPLSTLVLPQAPTAHADQHDVQDKDVNDAKPPPNPCPPGWKAYWSAPAAKYMYMNTRTGKSQWEYPTEEDIANEQASSEEIVTHGQAPSHNTQGSKSKSPLNDYPPNSLVLDDIPRLVAAQQRAETDQPNAPSVASASARQVPGIVNFTDPSHGQSQSLDQLPQISLSPSNGTNSVEVTAPDMVNPPSGVKKKSSSGFNKWFKRKSTSLY